MLACCVSLRGGSDAEYAHTHPHLNPLDATPAFVLFTGGFATPILAAQHLHNAEVAAGRKSASDELELDTWPSVRYTTFVCRRRHILRWIPMDQSWHFGFEFRKSNSTLGTEASNDVLGPCSSAWHDPHKGCRYSQRQLPP